MAKKKTTPVSPSKEQLLKQLQRKNEAIAKYKRELKIEAALDKVRSKAMAMKKSQDLSEAVAIVFEELTKLNLGMLRCGIGILNKEKITADVYTTTIADNNTVVQVLGDESMDIHPLLRGSFDAWVNKVDHSYVLQGKDLNDYYRAVADTNFKLPESQSLVTEDGIVQYYFNAIFSFGGLFAFRETEFPEEAKMVLKRFADVFTLTYTRFNDLKQAEAQTKEAKIDAALERVRSSSMAMHQSSDLHEVIKVVTDQLCGLNLKFDVANFSKIDQHGNWDLWLSTPAQSYPAHLKVPYFDHPIFNRIVEAQQSKKDFYADNYTFEEKNRFFNHFFQNTDAKNIPEVRKQHVLNRKGFARSLFPLKGIWFNISNYDGIPFTKEDNEIFRRFAIAFEQSYTRFLDLQKAEAQAKEAQIEGALERVRSRTMAMQKSEDLREVVGVLYTQLRNLEFNQGVASIIIMNAVTGDMDWWMEGFSDGYELPESYHVPYFDHKGHEEQLNYWKQGSNYAIIEIAGSDKKSYDNYYFNLTDFSKAPDHTKQLMMQFETVLFSMAFMQYGALSWSPTSISDEQSKVLQRFAKVFEQSYTRFLDLQKAEAQAREAQIETALERVRSKAMAMHSSQDLTDTIGVFYRELQSYSITPIRCGVGLLDKEERIGELYTLNTTEQGNILELVGRLKMEGHPVLNQVYDSWLMQTEYHPVLKGNEIKEYYKVLRPQMAFPDYHQEEVQYGHFFFFNEGGVYAWTKKEMNEDELQIYRRFTSVLSLTYKRYKDLKEAEAQTRETQIQLALERVRARTMAMQRSEELADTSQLLFEEFNKLNLVSLGAFPDRALIGIPDKSNYKVSFWTTDLKGTGIHAKFEGSIEEPYLFNKTIEAWKKDEKSIIIDLDGIELKSYLDYLKSIGFPVEENHYKRRRIHYMAFFSKGLIGISSAALLPPETISLLERFASVFDLTYTRFLDLQKSEAQVMESRIELALERVRARTMAMQRSDELADATEVLFKQFAELGNEPDRISIGIIDEINGFTEVWATNQAGSQLKVRFKARNTEKTTISKMMADWKDGKKSTIVDLHGEELKRWIKYLREELGMSIRDDHFNDRRLHQVSYFSQGWLNITTLEPLKDDVLSLLDRFAAVFNLTFTRFLDLQKAEAQTRQAQIETAMEKVRARSLAMQKPEELKEVAQVLRREMGLLGVEELEGSTIFIHEEGFDKADCWFAIKAEDQNEKPIFSDYILLHLKDTWTGRKMLEFFNSSEKQISIPMIGEHRREWIEYCYRHSPLFDGYYQGEIPDRIYHLFKFSNGAIGAAAPGEISAESWGLLQRATAVFSLAYTRFSDLQKSEANARDAIRQASLDRVRAEIASMRTTTDLERITPLMWDELTTLGVPFIRCGVFIMDEEQQQIHTFLSTADGEAIAAFNTPFNDPGALTEAIPYWRRKEIYKMHWDESAFIRQANNLMEQGVINSPEKYLTAHRPTNLHLHFMPFLQGMLYVGSESMLTEVELHLVQSLADAFSTAYARYEDFNKLESAKVQIEKTLVDLRQAQTQLIQSEKMASLGELTAGIAHEIQNPLNFVNNFSEVNAELIEEIAQAVQSGDTAEILSLTEDVKQNLAKIHFHGKRADGIVKSMLQHSRGSELSGKNKNESTDINALADEYLRLAYHGLRAKDKSFNSIIKTDFDQSIGQIEVVGQDISRAILNLITNALWAVHENDKLKKQAGEKYAPEVIVTTKRNKYEVTISVKDNGNGIPPHLLDKIFQPFFTTKPTGQGTGLGLSLTYDIVKAHGGEIKVETKEGEGSEFIIQLPIV